MKIWLAIITEDEEEYHVHFEGHTELDAAKAEMKEINNRLRLDGKLPLPYYIYEAECPPHGFESYNLDELDFNFYKEQSKEEKEKISQVTAEIEEAIATGDEATLKEAVEKAKEELNQERT